MEFPNKIVIVDLSNNVVKEEVISSEILRKFLGGRGLNAYLLLKYIGKNINAYDPENILAISNGILTGTEALSSARTHLAAVSPLSNLMGSSNVGGFFGAEMKACNGIISILIVGKAKTPVYLYIREDNVEIRDGSHLWGLDTNKSRLKIEQELDNKNIKVANIGQAGENQVAIANIMFGPSSAAGRTGLGAVMGSKKLKGIAIEAKREGSKRKKQSVISMIQEHAKKMMTAPDYKEWSKFGDSCQVKWLDDFDASPAYNYQQVKFERVDTADGLSFKDLKTKYISCYKCPIHCKAKLTIDQGIHTGFVGERPAFECMEAFGPKCGNPDASESLYLHSICNKWGMDSIEVGSLIAFAMNLYQKGIITQNETSGLELNWGEPKVMETLVDQIALRNSWLGDTFANGLRKASQIIGNGAHKYAYHVKGLAMTSMDPRGFNGTGLGYAVSSRGADFTNTYPSLECGYKPRMINELFGNKEVGNRLSPEGKAEMVRYTFRVSAIMDSIGICKIPYLSLLNNFDLSIPSELLNCLVGLEISPEKLLLCGERIVNAERLFNIRQGLKKSDDMLPDKFLQEPINKGICKGSIVDIDKMLNEFYSLMNWNAAGIPSEEKIKELGLDKI